MRVTTSELRASPTISIAGLLKAVVCFGVVAVLIERLWILSELPLWLDETWSAMIATQPSWTTFWREAWLDCNPPLYYGLLALWTALFGDSNIALRLPSLLFTTGAAAAAFRFAPPNLQSVGRWTWAGLILFWMHALTLSVDARGYGLLLLLSTLGCLVFARLYERLSLQTASLWVGIGALMFLTHYYAAALIAAQGLLLLYRHRFGLLKVWPAGVLGIPALAWFAFHQSRLQEYARPDVAWYDKVGLGNGIDYVQFVFGHPGASFLPLVLLIALGGLALRSSPDEAGVDRDQVASPDRSALWATALSGVLGVAIAFALGMIRASLTARYLVPMVPPVMLGLVLIALQSKRQDLVCLLLASVYLVSSLNFPQLREFADNRNDYGYEKGSNFIASYRPTHLAFAWDHPATKILTPDSLAGIGGYFLKRAGHDPKITPLYLSETDDPNVALSRAATGERPAIIWLYNTRRKSAARHYPPTFENDPAWSCRHFTQPHPQGHLGAIACVKKAANHA